MSVASVNYRLAPEHKFPAALEDAYAAVQWAANRGAEFGWDPQRIIVGGDSAGGNLSAAVCQLTRERSGPRLSAQLLVGALLDHDVSTESHRAFGSDFGTLTSRDVDWFLNHYVNSADELSDPRVSPLRASDLSGLPPAVIIVGALDPLRDEAVRYAERLREARRSRGSPNRPADVSWFLARTGRTTGSERGDGLCCAEPTESVGGALKPECATSDGHQSNGEHSEGHNRFSLRSVPLAG